jgi:hypothetical protein
LIFRGCPPGPKTAQCYKNHVKNDQQKSTCFQVASGVSFWMHFSWHLMSFLDRFWSNSDAFSNTLCRCKNNKKSSGDLRKVPVLNFSGWFWTPLWFWGVPSGAKNEPGLRTFSVQDL